MELASRENVKLSFFYYLAVNKLILDNTQNIYFFVLWWNILVS